MIKISTLKEGDICYDCHREKMGNTMMSRVGVWKIRVISIKTLIGDRIEVTYSWNGNTPRTTFGRGGKVNWRRYPPEWLRNGFDGASCYFCHNKKEQGHRSDCRHPKAVPTRAKTKGPKK